MRIDLGGKTALVTGSTAGIGRAILEGLAGAGADIVVNGRTQAAVDQAVSELGAAYPAVSVRGVAADISGADGCAAVTAVVKDVDILVNNVATFSASPFLDLADGEWTRYWETNVMSGVRMSRAYMGGMLTRNWGRIVFISSESAQRVPRDMVHYGTTKMAQIALARGLAESAAGTGVTVNSVLPGPTTSRAVGGFVNAVSKKQGITPEAFGETFLKTQKPTSILHRFTTPEEVANMVVYVCSPQASATTGAAMLVEGGVVGTAL
ncbi:SDR family oxidoreductase [Emcibacter sp. SYSU 3D8]|uniref:SDR family NAD(P)-dependent oxidoreductase n=1 Tax=Emcibacter sp. SYSU 3D8 TaxID=3133969 RepID=UPI0031FEE45E